MAQPEELGMDGEERQENVTTNLSAALLVCVRGGHIAGDTKRFRVPSLEHTPRHSIVTVHSKPRWQSPPPGMSPSSRPQSISMSHSSPSAPGAALIALTVITP